MFQYIAWDAVCAAIERTWRQLDVVSCVLEAEVVRLDVYETLKPNAKRCRKITRSGSRLRGRLWWASTARWTDTTIETCCVCGPWPMAAAEEWSV